MHSSINLGIGQYDGCPVHLLLLNMYWWLFGSDKLGEMGFDFLRDTTLNSAGIVLRWCWKFRLLWCLCNRIALLVPTNCTVKNKVNPTVWFNCLIWRWNILPPPSGTMLLVLELFQMQLRFACIGSLRRGYSILGVLSPDLFCSVFAPLSFPWGCYCDM